METVEVLIEVEEITLMIILHWMGDNLLQSKDMYYSKMFKLKSLLIHSLTYTSIWVIPMFLILKNSFIGTLLFLIITFIFHSITDYITSSLIKNQIRKKESFLLSLTFVLDQLMHYIQLILTFYYINKLLQTWL